MTPREGPLLVLGNHTSMFDPIFAAWHLYRRCNFMASAALFRIPILGRAIAGCGAFPKEKFVKDRDSMKTLNDLYEQGEAICMFPEGTRTWDGKQSPILPGIARLIKRLDGRVQFVRIQTGHLFHPRWAKYPRWVRVKVNVDEPWQYTPDMSEEDVLEVVRDRLRIDPTRHATGFNLGFRLAVGLPLYVWACPKCFSVGSLAPRKVFASRVACSSCEAEWKVDVSCRMNPLTPDTPKFIVGEAHQALLEHFGEPPVVDREVFEATGIALDNPRAELWLRQRGVPEKALGSGRLTLSKDRLVLEGTELDVALSEITAVSIEIGSALTVRIGDTLYRVNPSAPHTTLMWAHFIARWIGQESF